MIRETVTGKIDPSPFVKGEVVEQCLFSDAEGTNLTFYSVRFHRCTFGGFGFAKCSFDGCRFERCVFDGTFADCLFTYCRFDDCRFDDCRFDGCRAFDVRFARTFFSGVEMPGFGAEGVSFKDCEMDAVKISPVPGVPFDVVVKGGCLWNCSPELTAAAASDCVVLPKFDSFLL